MARKIDTDAEIDRIRLAMQLSHPSNPDSGYDWLYVVSGSAHGGLYLKDPSGKQIGPFITGSSASSPTDAEYVTTASHASLSTEVVIPGLAGSSDIAGSGGAGVSHEFDSGASPLTWSAAVDIENVNSTVLSHLYIQDNGASETLGTYDWSPAGAFDLRCKVSFGAETGAGAGGAAIGLVAGDSTMANRIMTLFTFDGSVDQWQVKGYTYTASTHTQRGATNVVGTNTVYLRLVRDGSNNCSFYYSMDGIMWQLIATQSFTFTAAKAGLRLFANSIVTNVALDWIRSDV